MLEQAAMRFPEQDPTWIRLFKEASEHRDHVRVRSGCRRLLDCRPDSLPLLNFAAVACLESCQYAYAARCAREATSRFPDFPRDQFAGLARLGPLL